MKFPEKTDRSMDFVNRMEQDLQNKIGHNKLSAEKLAASFGITDKTEVKELTELAIVKRARELAHREGTIRDRFDKIVELYYSQVNLSHRTSQSILLQQYSTPAPIGYLAGVFCGIHKPFEKAFILNLQPVTGYLLSQVILSILLSMKLILYETGICKHNNSQRSYKKMQHALLNPSTRLSMQY